MESTNVDKTIDIFKVVSRGLGYNNKSDGFFISNRNVNMELLLSHDTLTPVLTGISDMVYKSVFKDSEFESMFTTDIVKEESSLCFAVIKGKSDYRIEKTGFSLLNTHLISMYVMDNLLLKNKQGKVDLTNLANVWRNELSQYKNGDIIDLENHRKILVDSNLNSFPKLRNDLMELKSSNFKKNIFITG